MGALSYITILRPYNCLLAAIGVYVGFAVAAQQLLFNVPILLAMVSAFIICGAGQVVNDYFDRGIDAKIRPNKEIVSGKISPQNALMYSLVLFLIGVAIASQINETALQIAAGFSVLLILYSAVLGKIKYIGNWVVASGTAFTLIYGAAVVGNYGLIVIFAASAWLVNVGREITKDIEDIGADKGMKRSLPMIVGKNISKYMVFYAYAAGVFLSLWIFAAGIVTSQIYFILIALSAVVLGYCMLLIAQGKINASQRLSKLAMLIALIAYLSTIIK